MPAISEFEASDVHADGALNALWTAAAFAPVAARGWLRVTGEDRVKWLNGMTTNAIQSLDEGQGCYTFFLNAQGRIQADAYVWRRADDLLLETADPGALATMLDRFIIMDDVELEVLDRRAGLSLAGPGAAALLKSLGFAVGPLQFVSVAWNAQPVDVLQTYSPRVTSFELWSDAATTGLLAETLRSLGAAEASAASMEQFRILSGIPLFGTDIRDRDLPQETAQTRALHFQKGCYLGQEIVERIHSRGAVHRTFTGFLLTGDMPAAGAVLTLADAPDKPVGELTSVTRVGDRLFALGSARREALEHRAGSPMATTLTYAGGTATAAALPFSLEEAAADRAPGKRIEVS